MAEKSGFSKWLERVGESISDNISNPEGQQAAAGGVAGLGDIVSSLVGGRARRQEQKAAKQDWDEQMAQFKNMDYYGSTMANPWEDMTVNQLQAQFQAGQYQLGLANTMGALRGAAGGSGIAALAQSMSQQNTLGLSQISGLIGAQEAKNQQLMGQGEYYRSMSIQNAEQRVRDKQETLLALAGQRKEIADKARRDATEALVGGFMNVASSVGQLSEGG